MAVTYDHVNVKVYLDGSLGVTTPLTRNLLSDVFQINCIGRCSDARFDEVRTSNIARPAAWFATQYANQNNPGAFASIGTEQSQ